MQALPIFTFLLACLFFAVGVARNRSASELIWFSVILAGALYFFTGCTSCALWFDEMSVDLLGFIERWMIASETYLD